MLNDILGIDRRNLALHPGTGVDTGKQFTWRRNPKYFSAGKELSPGIVDIASVWFQAGHSVSLFS
jgi:hypothetical protein